MVNRVGTFFILLGSMLIGLFVLSDIAEVPTCGYLVWGVVSLVVGISLWFRDPFKPGPPAGRFRLFRKTEKKK